jgi:NAD(P)-dependent dehydrogenase (short-subunit alcohol dehydrogenase family)
VNLTGVFLTCREAARAMREGDGGSIVSTASIYGHVGSFAGTSPAYSAAKGGVVNLTREMAVSLAPHDIRVNAIAPGFVDTNLLESGIADLSEEEREGFGREIERRTLLGRQGDPEELMGIAVFLASDAASYVTGQSFPVEGGWLAQ